MKWRKSAAAMKTAMATAAGENGNIENNGEIMAKKLALSMISKMKNIGEMWHQWQCEMAEMKSVMLKEIIEENQ
jgi:hypothetical protein